MLARRRIAWPVIAGALGGNAAGATMNNLDLGTLGNTVAGALEWQ